MDVKKYKALKEAGRARFAKKGDKIIVEFDMFDPMTGELKSDVEIMVLSQVEQQVKGARKQIAVLNEELESFEAFLADMKES